MTDSRFDLAYIELRLNKEKGGKYSMHLIYNKRYKKPKTANFSAKHKIKLAEEEFFWLFIPIFAK